MESLEKAEYWRDRRRREEELRAEAQRLGIEPDLVEEEDEDMMEEDGQMSPVDEEREVDELVSAYLEAPTQPHSPVPGFVDYDCSFELDDDPEYDNLFMEVLSQEQQQGLGRQSLDTPIVRDFARQQTHDDTDMS